MSTTAAAPEIVSASVSRPTTAHTHPTFLGILRGELIKVLSLRSTWWMLAATVVLIMLVSLAVAWSLDDMAANPMTAPELTRTNGAALVSGGFQMGMVTIAVLGALLITGEYSTGMIRSTLAAVPTRIPVLVAKAIALAALTTVIATLSIALSYIVTMPQLAHYRLVPALDDASTWLVFGGTVYYLLAAALFSLGVGTLLRSTAGTITVALLILLVLPGVLTFINLDWVQTIASYLPLPASGAFLGGTESSLSSGGAGLGAGTGLLVVAAYAVVPLVAGAVVLRRRDA